MIHSRRRWYRAVRVLSVAMFAMVGGCKGGGGGGSVRVDDTLQRLNLSSTEGRALADRGNLGTLPSQDAPSSPIGVPNSDGTIPNSNGVTPPTTDPPVTVNPAPVDGPPSLNNPPVLPSGDTSNPPPAGDLGAPPPAGDSGNPPGNQQPNLLVSDGSGLPVIISSGNSQPPSGSTGSATGGGGPLNSGPGRGAPAPPNHANPEPSTVILFGAGLCIAALWGRARRRAR